MKTKLFLAFGGLAAFGFPGQVHDFADELSPTASQLSARVPFFRMVCRYRFELT